MKNKILQGIDLIYGASKYPWGLFRPSVVWGNFEGNMNGSYQELLFKELIKIGFKKTVWQLIFPEQTAGLIKGTKEFGEGTNEYHIRFYKDGTIDCELEVERFNGLHWRGPRKNNKLVFKKILNQIKELSPQDKKIIESLFSNKDYSNNCIRK